MNITPYMICTSIADKNFAEISSALNGVSFAEIRLDACNINEHEIRSLFATEGKVLVATCREGRYNKQERTQRLLAAIDAGASYVDIEAEADKDMHDAVAISAISNRCRLIVSHHDHEQTPDNHELCAIANHCLGLSADIVKIVTTAQCPEDNARILALYSEYPDLIAFAMGEKGKISRIACLYAGAPFTYAALNDSEPTACGQLSSERILTIGQLLGSI